MNNTRANTLHPNAKIYLNTTVEGSTIDDGASVGDFSKVTNSNLAEFSRIDRNNHVDTVDLGRYSYTGRNTVLLHCEIGSFCSLSWNVSVGGADHSYSSTSQHSLTYDARLGFVDDQHIDVDTGRYHSPVSIGSDVWLAAGVVVTRGVTIGHGAVVAANAVVTKDIPAYAVVAGVPAKVVKFRFAPDIVDLLLQLQWWTWPKDKIAEHIELLSCPPSVDVLTKLLETHDPI